MSRVVHRAGWLLERPGRLRADGGVLTAGGRIRAAGAFSSLAKANPSATIKDHGPGLLLARPINAHTHLSLSALAGLPTGGGFATWVGRLIRAREELDPAKADTAALAAARQLKDLATGFTVEIGSPNPAVAAMEATDLPGLALPELLGEPIHESDLPPLPPDSFNLSFSYAGHAPQTSAPELLRMVKAVDRQRGSLMSIHLAESEAEIEFIASGGGPMADLLTFRGLDFRGWGPWGETPVARAHRLGLLDGQTLAVHLIHTGPQDWAILKATGAGICLCPRSNQALHGRLPDLPGMLAAGLTPALGTDSLASTPSLSLWDELAFTAQAFPAVTPETLLAMATAWGAAAVGRPDLGRVEPGCAAGLAYLELDAASSKAAAEAAVQGAFARVEAV